MKTAAEYPISFPYGATSAPYSQSNPHKGADYSTPANTPLVIGNTELGLTGDTGYTFGAHLHVQAGRDEWAQQPINPAPYVFKPGTVVKTGTASQWGKYVCVKVGDVNVFYCHLNLISVPVGHVIGDSEVKIENTGAWFARMVQRTRDLQNRPLGTNEFVKNMVGHDSDRITDSLSDAPEAEKARLAQKVGTLAIKDNWEGQIHKLVAENSTVTSENRELVAENTELKARLAVQSEDTANLNRLGEVLKWFLVRVGLK